MSVHTCHESFNPRLKGRCDCGQLLPEPALTRRNPDFEREFVEDACRRVTDPDAIVQHAQTRALMLSAEYVDDPMTIAKGRDRILDIREELADCVNHATFEAQDNFEDYDRNLRLQNVLRYVTLAYNELLEED